jgi:pantetheine-phosphate adenylyltransferase
MGRSKFEEIHTVEGYQDADNTDDDDKEPSQCFERVVVGGTFDHLHAGHKILLTMTALLSTRDIVVGVTGKKKRSCSSLCHSPYSLDDAMLQSKKHKEWLEPIEKRLGHVQEFCQRIRPDVNVSVVPISDPYGPTITDPTMDALVCSQETLDDCETTHLWSCVSLMSSPPVMINLP